MIRSGVAHNTHRDRRIKSKLLSKNGRREKNRIRQELHRISKAIVEKAKSENLKIALERLTNIRGSSKKGMGKNLRGRLNRWPFRELKRDRIQSQMGRHTRNLCECKGHLPPPARHLAPDWKSRMSGV